MSDSSEVRGSGEQFSQALEDKIEAQEGYFEDSHPFLRTACRGLAGRLRGEFAPMGFVMETELYLADLARGVDGYNGQPMPRELTTMPPVMHGLVRLAAEDVAREAFGEDFVAAIKQQHEEMRHL